MISPIDPSNADEPVTIGPDAAALKHPGRVLGADRGGRACAPGAHVALPRCSPSPNSYEPVSNQSDPHRVSVLQHSYLLGTRATWSPS